MPGVDRVLWIGGAQWAGKTTVANLLSARHPVVRYAYDYHDARSHSDRARANPERFPAFHRFLVDLESDPDSVWGSPTPDEMAEHVRCIFIERFGMVLDDLSSIPDGVVVVAEGWGLRPELVAPHLVSPARAVFLVPSEDFRQRQLAGLGRAQRLSTPGVTDPERAQRNRIERDRILALEVLDKATDLGLPTLIIDGTSGPAAITETVEEQFRPFLDEWLY